MGRWGATHRLGSVQGDALTPRCPFAHDRLEVRCLVRRAGSPYAVLLRGGGARCGHAGHGGHAARPNRGRLPVHRRVHRGPRAVSVGSLLVLRRSDRAGLARAAARGAAHRPPRAAPGSRSRHSVPRGELCRDALGERGHRGVRRISRTARLRAGSTCAHQQPRGQPVV